MIIEYITYVCTLNSLISMEFFLFFLRTFSQLHALLEPPRLLISEKSVPNAVSYVMNMKKIPPPRLFDFGHFSLPTHY